MNERKRPTVEQIELRAYEIYLARGGEDGHALEDWIAAEKELTELAEKSASSMLKTRAARTGSDSN